MASSPKSIKITVVGDDMVGKTCLLVSYYTKYFPIKGIPIGVFEYNVKHVVDGQLHSIMLKDTLGQADYDYLRPNLYPGTACFLVCYSISGRVSYENVAKKWAKEVKHHMPHAPIILVATKVDLRDDPNKETISEKDGQKLKRRIKADSFIECSAKNRINLNEVFEEAVRCSVKLKKNTRTCTIL